MRREDDQEGSWHPAMYPPEIYPLRVSAIRVLAALKEALEGHGFNTEAIRVADVIETLYNLFPTPEGPEE